MFTVLTAVDERLVSIGLRNMIDWSGMDMEVVADVPNDAVALEIYEREKPDLILTDIKMPVMDGLELVSRIREKYKRTKIIILTYYQEFDMVHQALKLGVSDYILKLKMSTEGMESVIKKVHEELENDNRSNFEENAKNVDINYIKQNAVKDYIIHQICSVTEFERIVSKFQMRL